MRVPEIVAEIDKAEQEWLQASPMDKADAYEDFAGAVMDRYPLLRAALEFAEASSAFLAAFLSPNADLDAVDVLRHVRDEALARYRAEAEKEGA